MPLKRTLRPGATVPQRKTKRPTQPRQNNGPPARRPPRALILSPPPTSSPSPSPPPRPLPPPPRPPPQPHIPAELIRCVFEQLVHDGDLPTLYDAAFTCRQWEQWARQVLWSAPPFRVWLETNSRRLDHPDRCVALSRFVRRLTLTARRDRDTAGELQLPLAAPDGNMHAAYSVLHAAEARALGLVLGRVPWEFARLQQLDVDAALLQPYDDRDAAGATRAHIAIRNVVRNFGGRLTQVAVRMAVPLQRELRLFQEDRLCPLEGERGVTGETRDPVRLALMAPIWRLLLALGEGARNLEVLKIDEPVYAALLRSLRRDEAQAEAAATASNAGDTAYLGTESVAPSPPAPTFPSLRHLRLRLYHIAVPHLVSSTLAEHLTHLELSILPSTGAGTVAALAPLARNLEVLRLMFYAHYNFSADDLDALGSMTRLTDLRLWADSDAELFSPHLLNPRMEQLARAWPRLERLELTLHPPAFTPLALRHLALHCPRLRRVVIPGLRLNQFVLAGKRDPALDDPNEAREPPRLPLLLQPPVFPELRYLHLQTAGRPRPHESPLTVLGRARDEAVTFRALAPRVEFIYFETENDFDHYFEEAINWNFRTPVVVTIEEPPDTMPADLPNVDW